MEMKMETMETAIFSWMIRLLIAAHHAIIRATEQGQENARNLHQLGSKVAVMGTLHCSVAVCGIANPPQGMLAYVGYKQVILSVLLLFMVISGLIEIMAGMLVVVNPRPNHHLANIMLWVSHITTVFTIGFLLVRIARP